MAIGRDLIRVLQAVARIPEIELVWKMIVNDPKSLSPNFNGELILIYYNLHLMARPLKLTLLITHKAWCISCLLKHRRDSWLYDSLLIWKTSWCF